MAAIFEIHEPTNRVPHLECAPERHRARPARSLSLFVAVAAVLALLVLAVPAVSSVLAGPATATVEASGEFHVVSEGDTLHSVAESWAPAEPVSETIERIEELNGGIGPVALGDVISLPSR